MSTQEQRERAFEALMRRVGVSKWDASWTAHEIVWREAWDKSEAAAIERCAELIDGMNDSAGDRASYDNREMHEGEVERMNALSDAANAIRALLPKEES